MRLRTLARRGDPFVWLAGSGLGISLLMIIGLLTVILINGLGFFWPKPLMQLTLSDGTVALGEQVNRERIPTPGVVDAPERFRLQLKLGNRDLFGADFRWIDESDIAARAYPADAVLVERQEWGNFYGFVKEVRSADTVLGAGAADGWRVLEARLPDARRQVAQLRRFERDDIGDINYAIEQVRLAARST